jgi:dCTP deaminase
MVEEIMSLLSYNRLCELVSKNIITNVTKDQINSSSIDITLGRKLLVENIDKKRLVSLKDRNGLQLDEVILNDDVTMVMAPGQFILAQSEQVFNLPPNISAEYKLKSSMARIGLEHLTAGWCDAGWNGSVLTLELKNMTMQHWIALNYGVPIGQVVFFEHEPVPTERSYAARGRYNGDKEVQGIKP